MEYFCFQGDGLSRSSDAELVALATREFEQLDLSPAGTVRDGTVIRMPKAYPIYIPVSRAPRQRAGLDRPDPQPAQSGATGCTSTTAGPSMLTAMMAVWNMQGATHDIWEVDTDFEYHEEQRLEPPAAADAA